MNTRILIATGALALSACTTTFDGNKVDYKSQGVVAPSLEIPPDLTQLTKSERASVPASGAANASSYAATPTSSGGVTAATPNAPIAVKSLGAVRVQREGTQRWLVVDDRSPDKLWDSVKAFWLASGFTLSIDQPNLGIMETQWNENRAKIPQDGLRKLLGKVFDNIYSTNARDKYRIRLERTAAGGTEIYITHRGVEEDFADSNKTIMVWKPRAHEPELEIEFMQRLMVHLGAPADAAKAATQVAVNTLAAAAPNARARLVLEGGQSSLILHDAFDQAWRRVGLSLDKNNFTVEDRDRSKGVYFVRYVDPNAEKNAPGFFSKLFGAKAQESLQKYQVVVKTEGNASRVLVATTGGQPAASQDAASILRVLANDLK